MTPEKLADDVVDICPSNVRRAVKERVALAIRAAVAEEREACARIAELQCDVYNLGNCIARDIRARGS